LSNITLYHGTTKEFNIIDVSYGKSFKDFGRGFYATQSYDHALSIAQRNRRIELERQPEGKNTEIPVYVYHYELNSEDLSTLNIKKFLKPDSEWVEFVVKNRTERSFHHGFDLVIGATANDETRMTIQNYLFGAYGEPGSEEAIELFIKRIKVENLPTQWLFATTVAADLLKLIQKEHIR